ncbi:HIT family protein [Chloroflexia bacterium SDU3-3]|nr:HIT family protein [Chloroflexia bacterium SDU3-3]
MASIFSKIISGEIPSTKVYEDAHTYAFLDIGPASRGHTLVVPKQEYPDIYSIPPDVLAAVMASVQRVATAISQSLHPDGLNIVQNNGAAAGQTVFHFHVHLIPRWDGDRAMLPWKTQQFEQDELSAIAASIRQHL